MPRVLIVAYGNPLRSDDGVAWRAADALSDKFSSDVEIVRLHQLMPEMAETVSHCQCVIFIDASSPVPGQSEAGTIRIEELRLDKFDCDATRFSHSVSSQAVIALAEKLFGASPKAYVATVTGENFEHADCLSPSVRAALPGLIAEIESLVKTVLASGALPTCSTKP